MIQTTYDLQILNGRFASEDAQKIVSSMVQAKVEHHMHRIGQHTEEESMKASEARIKQLENQLREALVVLRNAAMEGKMVDMEGHISIKVVQ